MKKEHPSIGCPDFFLFFRGLHQHLKLPALIPDGYIPYVRPGIWYCHVQSVIFIIYFVPETL